MKPINKNWNNVHILVITIIAFLLRIFMLGNQSLWIDEATIYLQTKVDSVFLVYSKVFGQVGHIGPLFHILNYLFSQLFGYSEWALRMPSAIYGTVSVVLVYKIAEALKNNRVALYSSILMAFSPVHVWYSQEARMYSLWIMLILFTVLLFIKILKAEKFWLWILFTVFASLSIWAFLNSIFVFLSLGLYLLISIKKYKRQLCFYCVCMFIVFASYLPGIMPWLTKGHDSIISTIGSARKTTIFDFLYAFYVFNVGTTFGPSLVTIRALLKQLGATSAAWKILSQYGLLIIPSMLLYGFMFIYSTYKAIINRKIENNLFLLVMLFIPLLIIFGLTVFSNSLTFNIRYILCALPFYIILLSTALERFRKWQRRTILCFMLFFSVFSIFNHYFKAEYSKIDFRSVVKYLNDNMTDNDGAIIIHEGASLLLRYYDQTEKLNQYSIPRQNAFQTASSIADGSNKIFYVRSIRIQMYNQNDIQEIENLLKDNFKFINSVDLAKNIDIKIYERYK
ncbi:MAG: glycosyltransferase family 39 protein [Sedimentisphaerales bacterium]|nr:glycosyltransferase family 39 protein [Sedimentisphaerales bacterium]